VNRAAVIAAVLVALLAMFWLAKYLVFHLLLS